MDNDRPAAGIVTVVPTITGSVQIGIAQGTGKVQSKTVTPTREAQTVTPDAGYDALSSVTVEAIPKNYGLITYDGSRILVS